MAEVDLKKPILVTGGAGYIGTHTLISMIESDMTPVVLDNFVNSSAEAVKRVEEITGKKIELVELDLLDEAGLRELFKKHDFGACIHFAGLKSVGESTKLPLTYYHNNITGTLNLMRVMDESGCTNLVFSSSATVYGDPEQLPITETTTVGVNLTNPYGKTKYFIEEMCRDFGKANPNWNIVILRYFNPIGAHKSGKIGEDPNGIPNNLLPFVAQVAVGRREKVNVFGGDYDTVDGTGVRDYIHVVDLADGHVCALKKLKDKCGCVEYNLGCGQGTSVLQVIKAFEKACGKEIPYAIVDRRPGDIASCYSDPSKAEREMGFKTKFNIDDACVDSWRWQSGNPNGYKA